VLTQLGVHDFAIVDRAELSLDAGMTVLTGETGAGKSILVDALALALGERASSADVRAGAARAEVSAEFDLRADAAARAWLAERDLDTADGECVLRRTVNADGRSRAWINGRPVPAQDLRTLGEMLVDIHGQHAHQSLLRRDARRRLLDDFARDGADNHEALLASVAAAHERLQSLRERLGRLAGDPRERAARVDLLRYQVDELDALGVSVGEVERLEGEHARLAHAAEIRDGCAAAAATLTDDENGLRTRLGTVLRRAAELRALDPSLAESEQLLDEALIRVDEASAALRQHADGIDLDPGRLEQVAARLDAIHAVARKHRVASESLPDLHARLREERDGLQGGHERAAALERELEASAAEYRAAADALHAGRRAAARVLGASVSDDLGRLGMSGARLEVEVTLEPARAPSREGLDRVELLVSTNAGQAPLPLGRIASGGELSRLSLAIQVTTAAGTGVPTMIFDEVDAGIGGRVAEIVGRRLRSLAARRQVLCVTHLPQVASQADHHVRVDKTAGEHPARARLALLAGEARVREVARMLGGVRVTRQALEHAREMLERAPQGADA